MIMSKILLIEDEDSLREIVTFNLEAADHSVISTDNANEALMIMEGFIPDMILLDLMLPGLQGGQFLTLIKSNGKYADIPVIILSAKSTEKDIITGLENGAEDYLSKPFSIKILLAKINVILKRFKENKHNNNTSYLEIEIDEENHEVYVENKQVVLTHKEFELLSLFIKHPRRVFTRNQLLNTIWGYDSDVYTRTVDSHVSSLRKKLGNKGKIIKSIPKIGYKVE